MFAFKIKPGSAEFLAPMIDIEGAEFDENVTYYAIVDPESTKKIVSEEELLALEEAEGEEYIRFQ